MKSIFSHYYRPTDEELKKMWSECIFVLDTNVLLNLYRYSDETRKELIEILKSIKERIWIPYQAAYEYHENRLNVIFEQENAYKNVQLKLEGKLDDIKNELSPFSKHHSIDYDLLIKKIENIVKEINIELEKHMKNDPNWFENDNIRETISELFEGKVGKPFKDDKLKETIGEGAIRYKCKVPPGYMDKKDKDKKDDDENDIRQYGDLIIWFQTIEKAKETNKPIVFITDDKKEDWWYKTKGRTVGPRIELLKEMKDKANVNFYMYQADRFFEYARKLLNYKVSQEAIDEVKEFIKINEISDLASTVSEKMGKTIISHESAMLMCGNPHYIVNQEARISDVPPLIKGDVVYTTIRVLSDIYNVSTKYDEKNKTVHFIKGDSNISLNIESGILNENDNTYIINNKPFIKGGRLYLPILDLSKIFGFRYKRHYEDNKLSYITFKSSSPNVSRINL